MKTMPATKVSHQFGRFLDEVQRGPVVVTKKDRPVAVTMSIHDAAEFREFQIEKGIHRGLADIEAGRFEDLTSDTTEARIADFKVRVRGH